MRWAFGLGVHPEYPDDGLNSCMALISAELFPNSGSGSFELRALGHVSGSTFGFGASSPPPKGPSWAASLRLGLIGSASSDPAARHATQYCCRRGPRPGERIFGQFFPGPLPVSGGQFEITAVDAAGAALGTLTL